MNRQLENQDAFNVSNLAFNLAYITVPLFQSVVLNVSADSVATGATIYDMPKVGSSNKMAPKMSSHFLFSFQMATTFVFVGSYVPDTYRDNKQST